MSTIFALATPPGKSGVAVIRVSGVAARDSLYALGITLPQPRVATLAALHYNGETIDKALVLYFSTPNSFTGEDVVEFHCHGSRATLNKLLDIFGSLPDFCLAEPGEFTRRAFMNGKMDLTAAEGLADLIDADTEAQRKQALRIMEGQAGEFFENLRKSILHTLAFLEAYIDFPDEDIPDNVLAEIDREVAAASALITSQLADNHASEKIRDGLYITILGAPNVGKSSLMNLLAKRDVAIVSNIAGTTRDVIEVQMDIKGYSVILADTAGIRENADVIEQEGIRRSFERAKTADIHIIVLDAAAAENADLATIASDNSIIVLNKSDITTPQSITPVYGIMPIIFSARERTGMDELMRAIEHKITSSIPPEASFVSRNRHRAHLTLALEHLQKYSELQGQGLELKCEELRRAATEVGKITGKIAVDELLGHIFSSFCIGK